MYLLSQKSAAAIMRSPDWMPDGSTVYNLQALKSSASIPVFGLDTEGGDRVRNMSSLAVTPDGTTYLTTESHHLVRVDDQGFVRALDTIHDRPPVFSNAARRCRARWRSWPTTPR